MKPTRHELAVAIRRTARVSELRKLALLTTETFIAAEQRTGLPRHEIGRRLLDEVIDEQAVNCSGLNINRAAQPDLRLSQQAHSVFDCKHSANKKHQRRDCANDSKPTKNFRR
jgi:hypothetical protein